MKLKYIITGTGRNGTGYFSELLKLNGISCGHEQIFGLNGLNIPSQNFYKSNLNNNNKFIAESSWLIAPYLNESFITKDIQIIFLIRDPIKTIKSLYDVTHITKKHMNSPYLNHIMRHLNISINNDLDFLIEFYIKWSNMIESYLNKFDNSYILRFEDINLNQEKLSNIFNKKIEILDKEVNTKTMKKKRNINIDDVLNNVFKNSELKKFVYKYNYIDNYI